MGRGEWQSQRVPNTASNWRRMIAAMWWCHRAFPSGPRAWVTGDDRSLWFQLLRGGV